MRTLKRIAAGCGAAAVLFAVAAVIYWDSPVLWGFLLYEEMPFSKYTERQPPAQENETPAPLPESIDAVSMDYEYLVENIYSIETRADGSKATGMPREIFNAAAFMGEDLKLAPGEGPKILILSAHGAEKYADSDSDDAMSGVLEMGSLLSRILCDDYEIFAIHHSGVYSGYAQAEAAVTRILDENPGIEVIIDLHRDGVAEGRRLTADVDGKPAAQIMFVNGMSMEAVDGVLTNLPNLPNPNLETNLSLSFRLQLEALRLYGGAGLMRRIYLKPYRYGLHLAPKSLLVEIGAQTNTTEEAENAVRLLAEILANVLT